MVDRSSSAPMKAKLRGLQYLRGIAALGVVAFHAAERTGYKFNIGKAGVDLFFVLSGFLMIAITNERTTSAGFMINRMKRIIPVYWIATSITLAGAVAGAFPHMRLTAWHIMASYLFIPSYSPSDGKIFPVLVPGWTLNYEMAFYVLFAAALMFLKSDVWRVGLLSVVFGALVFIGRLGHPTTAIGVTYTDPILLEFALGSWIGILWKRFPVWPSIIGWPTILLAVALACLLLRSPDSLRAVNIGVPAGLLVLGTLGLERKGRVVELRLPLLIGDASYSIYLWHTLLLPLAVVVCVKAHLPNPVCMFVAIICSVVGGLIGFIAVEEPARRLLRSRRPGAVAVRPIAERAGNVGGVADRTTPMG